MNSEKAGPQIKSKFLSFTGKGDQQWHHETVTVEDAVLRQGGIKGSDFALVNTDDKDDIFSLIEVRRGLPVVTALLPPSHDMIYDKDSKRPNAKKKNNREKSQKH